MRFTSLVVELIRARPRLVVVIVVLCHALLWLGIALLFYRSPPGQLAMSIAFGREYQVGTDLGAGAFRFTLEIIHPRFGRIIRQSAMFRESAP